MYRDDANARDEYIANLERKAARVDELEARVRELEAALQGWRTVPSRRADEALDATDHELEAYAAALVRATAPERASGILSGATPADVPVLLAAARDHARANRRPRAVVVDVLWAA